MSIRSATVADAGTNAKSYPINWKSALAVGSITPFITLVETGWPSLLPKS